MIARGEIWWADAPGNVLLEQRETGLPKAAVANVSQIVALDRSWLTERAGSVAEGRLDVVLAGLDVVLGR